LIRVYKELCSNSTLENLIDPNEVYIDEKAGVIKLCAKPYILQSKSYLKEQLSNLVALNRLLNEKVQIPNKIPHECAQLLVD
jgi:hypothetical protein